MDCRSAERPSHRSQNRLNVLHKPDDRRRRQVEFTELLPGVYSISIVRMLSVAERAQLTPTHQEVDALGGALIVSVATPATSAEVAVVASRRGSLVISEIWSGDLAVGTGYYDDGDFMRSTTTPNPAVLLAGKLVVYGFPGSVDNPPLDHVQHEHRAATRLIRHLGHVRLRGFPPTRLRWRQARSRSRN